MANIWVYTGGFCKFELSILQVWTLILQVEFVISQLGDDSATWRWFATCFAAWRWFRNVVCSCEDGVSTCEVAHVCLEVVSQLRNTLRNFASGFHFAAHFVTAKFSHSLMQLSSNDHNFFVSTPIGASFEVLDSWLTELRNEIHLRNFARCFAAAEPPPSTHVPLCKLKLHLRSCEPRCEITSKMRNKLQIISKLRNHLQVVKSQIQLAKWTIQTCKIHLCKLRYLPPTKLDFFLKIFCVNFYFLLVISQRYYWDIS